MKITLEPTTKIVMIKPSSFDEGVPARVWVGISESGIKVQCYITRIAINKNEPNVDEFENELLECQEPSMELNVIPNRLILDDTSTIPLYISQTID